MNARTDGGQREGCDRQAVTGSDGDDGTAPQAQGAAVQADDCIITAISHGIDGVEAEGPQNRGQPAADQGRLQRQASFRCGPGDQHGKAPAESKHRLGVSEPALGGGIEEDRRKSADREQQA